MKEQKPKGPYGLETLSKEVKEQFEFPGWVGSHRQKFGRFGTIDLSTLTVQQAERLVGLKFAKIKKKEVKVTTTAVAKAK